MNSSNQLTFPPADHMLLRGAGNNQRNSIIMSCSLRECTKLSLGMWFLLLMAIILSAWGITTMATPANIITEDHLKILTSGMRAQLSAFSYNDHDDKALFLTPLIESGQITEGQRKARVVFPKYTASFSGFFTVNESFQSNLFFWFCLADKAPDKAPLMIWLEGGPGETGFFGAFVQHGPFILDSELNLHERKNAWTKFYNMLYIDQPVGTGFSFTRDNRGYATNLHQATEALYEALMQFFKLFPTFRSNDFYVAGISYGGKFATALSHKILTDNTADVIKINLKGVIIGSGFIDPTSLADKADYYYQTNFIDKITREWSKEMYQKYLVSYKQRNIVQALQTYLEMESRWQKVVGYDKTADFLLLERVPPDYFHFENFVQLETSRKAFHVGNETFNTFYGAGQLVREKMMGDLLGSVKDYLEELLNTTLPVLIYHGQMDITLIHTHTTEFLKSLNWPGAAKLNDTVPSVWLVNGVNAGHITVAENLVLLVIRTAGHIVVHDQPQWTFEMIKKYRYGKDWMV